MHFPAILHSIGRPVRGSAGRPIAPARWVAWFGHDRRVTV
jgi:hypothetical protein